MYSTNVPRRLHQLLLLLLLFAAIPLTVHAQQDQGRIGGVVSDANGAIVPGASIIIKNERTGEERTATSSDSGSYIVSALRPSLYTVTANAQKLSVRVTNVQLLVGQELNLNLTLQATGVEEKVDIVAAADTGIDTGSAAMGVNVNPREVEALPLNGRQLSQLYLQAPGSMNSGSGTFGDIRFSGRAVQQNVIRYDGIEGSAIIDASPGNLNGEVPSPFRLQSSLENVQEFRVDSNNFPAEFGTGTGGQISVVTKSGSNAFHGSLFEYIRNDALDAANFFDNIIGQKSPLRLNQFGGSLGGPLYRNKFFFFFSYEGYRLRAGVNSIEAVPGSASRLCKAPFGTGTLDCTATSVALLPAFRSPDAAIISTGSGTNVFDVAQLQANSSVNENSTALRLDYRLNNKHSAYFRFFRDQGSNDQPEGVTGRRVAIKAVPQNGVLAVQSLLSPTLLNEFKLGYNSAYTRINGQAPTIAGFDLSSAVINISGNTANFALPGQGTSAGTATPGGLVRANSATNGRGQPYTPYTLSFVDSVNWTKGEHNAKFGGELRLIRLYTDRLGGTTYTYSNLTSFLANTPQSIQFLGDVSAPSPFNNGATGQRYAKQEYYIAYAEDEWKLRPNLTLNYGLRYEYYTPLREDRNLQVLFDITNGTLRPPTEAAFQSSKTNFGPRIAMTWSPKPNSSGFFGGGRTVLRGGFGIFYGPGQTEDQIQPIESDRVSSTFTSNPIFPNGPALAFPLNSAAAIAFFNNPANVNTRAYQPRAYSPDYKIPEKVYQYTFSLQQELFNGTVLTAAYVGSQGRNLFLRSVANKILPGQTTVPSTVSALPAGFGVVNLTNDAGRVIGVRTVREFSVISGTNALQPFAEVDYKTSGGDDSYNALQMTLARRLASGLTLNSQYTFSRSFGNTAGSNEARTAAIPDNFEADRGYNNFDVRHTFNISALYKLPFGKGTHHDFGSVGNALLGDWEIGGIVNARSGLPIEVGITRPDVVIQCAAASCPVTINGVATTVPTGFVAQLPGTVNAANPLPVGFVGVVNTPGGGASRNVRRPNIVPGVNPFLNNDRSLINPAAFSIPLPGQFGDLPRNALRGPSFKQFDIVLNKRFPLTESTSIEFRTEIFNIFNFANFAAPSTTLNNALPTITSAGVVGTVNLQPGSGFAQSQAGGTFGLLRQTVERTVGLGTSRQIQFALRLNF
ncbi:MAG TPA: carboxypeptidase regulatory-like domain-containing protein [Pyrinomonadaceae bacterium]|nr:carboxypeptidase regulatory-like domain-containing protein [Pyrinomonadaceae bacterium]